MADGRSRFCYTGLLIVILTGEMKMALSISWKRRVARLMRWSLMQWLMAWGIRLIVPRRPVGVGVVLLDADGRVLLLRHVFHPHRPWGLPGGWLKRPEAPHEGALRELREETGLTAVLGPVLAVDETANPVHVGIIYLAYPQTDHITLSDEILAADWFWPDDLPDILPFQQQAIATAVQNYPRPCATISLPELSRTP